MALTANSILSDVSLALIDGVCRTTLGSTILSGVRTVVPPDMSFIFAGAQLIIGGTQEVITVSSVATTSFTATFANAHSSTDSVTGATFPSGRPDNILFSATEVLQYLADVQTDFLLRTECVYAVASIPLTASNRIYLQPADCVRIQRISISGKQLFDTSEAELDMDDPSWVGLTTQTQPTAWFQDQVGQVGGVSKFGFKEVPLIGSTASVWYSQRGPAALGLADTLLVPDIFGHYLKYGVLSRCFSKEGEQRDPLRSEYCERRYKFGVNLTLKFMDGVQPGMRSGVPIAMAFNPMVVPQDATAAQSGDTQPQGTEAR